MHSRQKKGGEMHKMKLAVFTFLVALGGCATATRLDVTQLQSTCEKNNRAFPEVADCLKNAITTLQRCASAAEVGTLGVVLRDAMAGTKECYTSDISDSALRLYLLKAEQLSQRVQKHEIADLDARVTLQQLYVELGQRAEAQRAAQAAANAANRPIVTKCQKDVFGEVTCTSK